jgi:bifunctional DNase/RNase
MVQVLVRALRVGGASTAAIVLQEAGGSRILQIHIGAPEAALIGYAIQELKTPRPMTHDVMISLAELQGGEIVEVEITGLVGNTFMAELRLKLNDKVEVLSIRPSDAIAVAIRAQVPLGVSADLLDFAGTDLEDEFDETEAQTQLQVEDIDEGALISELRDFLESVNPEDFKP